MLRKNESKKDVKMEKNKERKWSAVGDKDNEGINYYIKTETKSKE
jgi:hypothetical protein